MMNDLLKGTEQMSKVRIEFDMPACCGFCSIYHAGYDGNYYCSIAGKSPNNAYDLECPKWCPLTIIEEGDAE